MLTFYEIFAILLIHGIADFIFQDEKWAVNKSKSVKALLKHTITYSLIWFTMLILLPLPKVLWFVLITFIAHTITDFFTSKVVSKKFARNEYGSAIPNFGAFTCIEFDQLLHYSQLFLTYLYLK